MVFFAFYAFSVTASSFNLTLVYVFFAFYAWW